MTNPQKLRDNFPSVRLQLCYNFLSKFVSTWRYNGLTGNRVDWILSRPNQAATMMLSTGLQASRCSSLAGLAPAHLVLISVLFSLLVIPSVGRAAFENYEWSARSAGLAGAYSALVNDSYSPEINPAGLSYVEGTDISMMYARLFSGETLYAGSDSTSLGLGHFGVSPALPLGGGRIGAAWDTFNTRGVYQENTWHLAWARPFNFLGPKWAGGVNLKWLNRRYTLDARTTGDATFSAGRSQQTVGMDVGFQGEPAPGVWPGFRTALVWRNLNSPDVGLETKDRLPSELRLGLAYQSSRWQRLVPTLDYAHRGHRDRLMAGVESWVFPGTFCLRAGYNADEAAAGFSLKLHEMKGVGWQLDYASGWPLRVEGTSGHQRISLSARFGPARK